MFNAEAIASELKTLNEFEAWLKSKPGDEIVGMIRDSCHCPISTFLRVKSLADLPEVGLHTIGSVVDEGNVYHSLLSSAFVRRIDRTPCPHRNYDVTAAQALEVLAEVRSNA